MDVFQKHERLLALTPTVVLWGCFGGICLAAVNFFLQAIWTSILDTNYTLFPVYQVQIIGSFAILAWTLGAIAADFFRTGKNTGMDPVLAGLLSGICSALVFTSIIVYYDIISHPLTFFYTNDPFLMRLFLDRLFHQWLILLAGFILISGILQALGSWYQGIGSGRAGTSHKPAFIVRIRHHRFLFIALLAVLIIPPGLVYLGMGAGVIEKQSNCCTITDSVNISRTGPDSIQIVMKPDPDTVKKASGRIPFIKIFLNEKEVSNQSVITEAGWEDTIDPKKGLLYQEGASVTLQGKDVSGNRTAPAHLVIIVTYPDRGESAIICDRDI
jgi:hypothetical protein